MPSLPSSGGVERLPLVIWRWGIFLCAAHTTCTCNTPLHVDCLKGVSRYGRKTTVCTKAESVQSPVHCGPYWQRCRAGARHAIACRSIGHRQTWAVAIQEVSRIKSAGFLLFHLHFPRHFFYAVTDTIRK